VGSYDMLNTFLINCHAVHIECVYQIVATILLGRDLLALIAANKFLMEVNCISI
jgi:hypothetical protein